jgi:hypothetical protein
VRPYWRCSADVTRPLEVAPEPPVLNEDHLPIPCVVHPEQVREYQYGGLLPEELDARIEEWEVKEGNSGLSYQSDLSLAPGWKVGGFANWSLTDPQAMDCTECGRAMTLLFTAASYEWGGRDSSWQAVEEPAQATAADPEGSTAWRCFGRKLRMGRLGVISQGRISMYPSVPCTRIRCPSGISWVASTTPTTAGNPYSRAITAP